MMPTHELKSWPGFFEPVLCGEKTAELRYNDRNYRVGDLLMLREWEPGQERYTGRECVRLVTHVLYGVGSIGAIAPLKGLSANYVLLSIKEVDRVYTTQAA